MLLSTGATRYSEGSTRLPIEVSGNFSVTKCSCERKWEWGEVNRAIPEFFEVSTVAGEVLASGPVGDSSNAQFSAVSSFSWCGGQRP